MTIIWGAANFTTGSALFMTADVPLSFFSSIYMWWAVKYYFKGQMQRPLSAGFLGFLHGIAYVTKMVALIALSIVPFLVSLTFICKCETSGSYIKYNLTKPLRFLFYYFLALLIIICLFSYGCFLKYQRFTIGDTGTYNYGLYIAKSNNLLLTQAAGRRSLPKWGTYWWSDISITQIRRVILD